MFVIRVIKICPVWYSIGNREILRSNSALVF